MKKKTLSLIFNLSQPQYDYIQLVLDLFVHLTRVFSVSLLPPCPSISQNHAFWGVVPLTSNGLPLELCLFPSTLSLLFFSHLKTVLFSDAGVESASE